MQHFSFNAPGHVSFSIPKLRSWATWDEPEPAEPADTRRTADHVWDPDRERWVPAYRYAWKDPMQRTAQQDRISYTNQSVNDSVRRAGEGHTDKQSYGHAFSPEEMEHARMVSREAGERHDPVNEILGVEPAPSPWEGHRETWTPDENHTDDPVAEILDLDDQPRPSSRIGGRKERKPDPIDAILNPPNPPPPVLGQENYVSDRSGPFIYQWPASARWVGGPIRLTLVNNKTTDIIKITDV